MNINEYAQIVADRKEESLFDIDSHLAQIVIGVRRSGKSTICHKVLKESPVSYTRH